ncbi:hypothetical protein [Peribacillus butanolivorans]
MQNIFDYLKEQIDILDEHLWNLMMDEDEILELLRGVIYFIKKYN